MSRPVPGSIVMDEEAWRAEGESRFGPDQMRWRFVCPCCGYEQGAEDYKRAGAPSSAVGFSCVGRWLSECREAFADGPGPCNYAGAGLFALGPVRVQRAGKEDILMFAFADAPLDEEG